MLDRPPTKRRTRNFEAARPASDPGQSRSRGMDDSGSGLYRRSDVLMRPLPPMRQGPDEMKPGLAVSGVLHVLFALLIVLGLPNLFRREPPADAPAMIVEIVNPSELTRTTKVNPHPKAEAKPVPPPVVPEEKPTPPVVAQAQPAPAPPPPSKPEPAPTPPPPPPEVKPEPKPAEPPPPPPAPKPDPKPVPPPPPPAPKPPPPKPEPPKQIAKVEPPKPDKQKQPDDFDALLNNLTKVTPVQERSDLPPKPQKPPPLAQQASSLPNAPLGSQVSTSEKEMIAAAVNQCFEADGGVEGASSLVAKIQFDVAPDGTVRGTKILGVEGGGSDAIRRAFAERAKRAPLQALCNKLPIPAGKYDELKDLIMNFTIKGAL